MTDSEDAARRAGRPSVVVLVRNAESARNVAKKGNRFFLDDEARKSVQGVSDHRTALTAEGRRQAQRTGPALREAFGVFDYAYHSGYQRTRETLEHLLAGYPADERSAMCVRHHLFLRERDTGFTFDMTTAEAEAAFPWLQDYWNTYGPIFGRPPGGESLADVAKRAYLFLGMLFRERAGQRVLVVTHGGTLWMFRMLLERWTWEEAEERFTHGSVPQCSVTSYRYEPAANRLVAGDVSRVYWR
jgi:2,3-bisphosphoglycerate-dependent phosphoglycerate mutase